mgnify:CR=1 FL=1
MGPDNRGSAPQRHIYDECVRIYGQSNVAWELVIPELGQRFDIFLKQFGIAIEIDGEQHDRYVDFFHKDINGYMNGIHLDKRKMEWAEENHVSVIRYSTLKLPSIEQLRLDISKSISTSSDEFSMSVFETERPSRLTEASDRRKKLYRSMKNAKK